MKIYYDKDADLQHIRSKKVAVIGYGSQGHAHALNMKESGVDVVIGLREGASWKKAEQSGLKVMPVADAVKASDVVMILAPDEAQAAIYRQDVAPYIKPGGVSCLRPRIQHSFRSNRSAGHRERVHGGAERPGSPRPVGIYERQRGTLLTGHSPGSERYHETGGVGLCRRHRRRTCRRDRDEFPRGNGNRSLR